MKIFSQFSLPWSWTLSLAFILGSPDIALALQSHGAPEGLYVHQMAHIHYCFALGYLFWDIRRSSFTGKGWRYLQAFCVLMLLWNINAFTGHAVDVFLDAEAITAAEGYLQSRLLGPLTLQKMTFYITKFDHLICVPALFFLFIGLRSFYRTTEKKTVEEKT